MLVLLLLLVLDLLAIRAEKRFCSGQRSSGAGCFLEHEHEHKHEHDF